ncbi:MAG: glycosyltransferase [Pseudomonadota bacterium]
MANPDRPYFSIILCTRDRPDLLQEALQSVLVQTEKDREIIVVVDGSSEENLAHYRKLSDDHSGVRFLYLVHLDKGHGQSYALNFGVSRSQGEYLCFLDDDDHWTDENHLRDARSAIEASGAPVDLLLCNQKALFSDRSPQTLSVWLEDLIPIVHEAKHHRGDWYFVDTDFLMTSGGFGHVNCSIYNATFYVRIGGMDDTIRYENDRDIYLRAIDAATCILYTTRYISHHNIPDPRQKKNLSTAVGQLDKKLSQLRVYDKGLAHGSHESIRAHCKLGKAYELKKAAQLLAEMQRFGSAATFANAALINGFNLRWLAYTIYLNCKSRFGNNQREQEKF